MDIQRQQDVAAARVTRYETGFGPGRVLIAGPPEGLPGSIRPILRSILWMPALGRY